MKKLAFVVPVILAACSPTYVEIKPKPDASGGTADAPGMVDSATPAPPVAIVAAGDYTAGHPGVLGALDIDTMTMTPMAGPAGAVGDDPMLRAYGGNIYIVNRSDGNNVTILDASTRMFVDQLSTGAGSNPQDVAVLGQTLYVPVYGGAGVAVLTRGSTTIDTIDLSSYDPDGKPNCVSVYLVGTDLYIACELADDSMFFAPRGPGAVFVYDTTMGTVRAMVTMATKNPFGVFHKLENDDLVIPTVDFSAGTGCVEKIMVGMTPTSGGCVVNNSDMGAAYVNRIEMYGNTMWMSWTASDYAHATVQAFSLSLNTLASPALTPSTEVAGDVAVCRDGTVVIADQTMNASGVRVYKGGSEVTTAPLSAGLPTKSTNALVCY
jgi:hypothetical protein